MSVLHVTSAREWRGGENQLALLLHHLPEEWRGTLAAPANSAFAARLGGVLPVLPVRSAGFGDIRSVLALRQLIGSGAYRLVHAHTSPAHASALLARLGTGVPLVVSRRNAFRAKGGWKYEAVDRFITVSRAGREKLLAAGVAGERIAVIPDMVEKPAFACEPSGPVVVCVAALSVEKDHETLLRAWRDVEHAASQARLRLVGEGPLRARLEAMALALGLRRVEFLGERPAAADLARARLAVLTSREEGLGSAICLAQTMGVPAVVTDAGGLPEAIEAGRTGIVVPAGDAQAVAHAIIELLENGEMREAMGRAAALRAAMLFDPARNATAHIEVYQDILSGLGR
ncbi:MAG: glycosyltransferase family 4 protein [Flavobacteriaceae bacterium]